MTTQPAPLDVDDISVPGERYELELYPIPVIAMTQSRTHQRERTLTAETFGATLYRRANEEETWVFLGNDEQRLEISLESARRLQRALRELLIFHDKANDENLLTARGSRGKPSDLVSPAHPMHNPAVPDEV